MVDCTASAGKKICHETSVKQVDEDVEETVVKRSNVQLNVKERDAAHFDTVAKDVDYPSLCCGDRSFEPASADVAASDGMTSGGWCLVSSECSHPEPDDSNTFQLSLGLRSDFSLISAGGSAVGGRSLEASSQRLEIQSGAVRGRQLELQSDEMTWRNNELACDAVVDHGSTSSHSSTDTGELIIMLPHGDRKSGTVWTTHI